MFRDQKGVVAIWLAADVEKPVLEKYFHGKYGGEEPLNQFARDAGDTFYDEDFVELNWVGRSLAVEKLLQQFSYGESFAAAGTELARKAGLERAKFAFVMYDAELKPAKWPQSSPLQYLGAVPYSIPYTGPQLRPDDHRRPINESLITPNGKFGLTTSWDAELRLWNMQTGELLAKHGGIKNDDGNNRVAIAGATPRGELLTYRHDLVFWKPSSTGLARIWKVRSPHRAGISQAIVVGKRLITSSFDKTLAVWNSREEKPSILTGHAGRVYRIALLPGGRILSGDDEGEFRIWSLRSSECLATISIPKGLTPHLLHATSDGSRAIVCSYGALGVIDLENGKFLKYLHLGDASLDDAAVTPDEKRIVVAWEEDGQAGLQIWDLPTGKLKHTLVGHAGELECLAVSGDSQTAATVGCDANVVLWNLKTGRELARFSDAPAGRPVPASFENDGYMLETVAINSAGDRVLCGEASGRVRILKREGKKLIAVR